MQKIMIRKDVYDEYLKDKQDKDRNIQKNIFFCDWEEIIKENKYSKKEFKNGKWIYYYDKNDNFLRMKQCKSNLLSINSSMSESDILQVGKEFLNTWKNDWKNNPDKSICIDIRGKIINFANISLNHLATKGKMKSKGYKTKRNKDNLLGHIPYLTCAKELLESHGVFTQARYEKNQKPVIDKSNGKTVEGIVYQTVSGLAPKNDTNNYVQATVSSYKYSDGTYGDTVYISVMGTKSIKKSMEIRPCFSKNVSAGGSNRAHNFVRNHPSQSKKMSRVKPDYNGIDMFHKSFDIDITEITENNKAQKMEQVEKALNAIYNKVPFGVNHIKADNSKRYNDVVLRITNFDKEKIQKAVHTMAFSLDTKIKSAKGEAFNYKAQEQLTDNIVSELTEKTKDVYSFLIAYFGLPEVRIISKANLEYKGKVLYDPESGKPIPKSEWDKFVKALEKYLNRNYTGIGKKIVLSGECLGRILERLSKTNSLEAIKNMNLNNMSYKGKSFDWISKDVKNMQSVFGESLDRFTQSRIQVAMDSATTRIAKVTDDMRNDIKQVIIDGIKNKQSKAKISQNLFDKCSGLNRDFQRIADTEIQNNANNAYLKEEVYKTPSDEKIYFRRFEQVDDNTCKKCKAINSKLALWSNVALTSEKIDDPYAEYAIWEGKTDGVMPVSIVHPYCRGGWYRYYPELDKK